MQIDVSRMIFKMKALDRWENEGGRIYTGRTPMNNTTSKDMQTSKDNDSSQFRKSYEEQNGLKE